MQYLTEIYSALLVVGVVALPWFVLDLIDAIRSARNALEDQLKIERM